MALDDAHFCGWEEHVRFGPKVHEPDGRWERGMSLDLWAHRRRESVEVRCDECATRWPHVPPGGTVVGVLHPPEGPWWRHSCSDPDRWVSFEHQQWRISWSVRVPTGVLQRSLDAFLKRDSGTKAAALPTDVTLSKVAAHVRRANSSSSWLGGFDPRWPGRTWRPGGVALPRAISLRCQRCGLAIGGIRRTPLIQAAQAAQAEGPLITSEDPPHSGVRHAGTALWIDRKKQLRPTPSSERALEASLWRDANYLVSAPAKFLGLDG